MMTLGVRVKELRALAKKRGVDGRVGDIFDPRLLAQSYADVLGLNASLVYDLDLSLDEIVRLSEMIA